jgi:hypothetical protein
MSTNIIGNANSLMALYAGDAEGNTSRLMVGAVGVDITPSEVESSKAVTTESGALPSPRFAA